MNKFKKGDFVIYFGDMQGHNWKLWKREKTVIEIDEIIRELHVSPKGVSNHSADIKDFRLATKEEIRRAGFIVLEDNYKIY